MSEPNSLDLMYEALTRDATNIYKENPGMVIAAVVKAAGGVVRISSDDVLMAPPLSEEIIVAQIWEMVILIEAHEIKEFFRVDGLCLQEPHPESPRELAYNGTFDRWDFIDDLMRGRGHGGKDPRAVETGP